MSFDWYKFASFTRTYKLGIPLSYGVMLGRDKCNIERNGITMAKFYFSVLWAFTGSEYIFESKTCEKFLPMPNTV